jgi:ubiquinone/menaquinone biosynthesis C-methylase UbiE
MIPPQSDHFVNIYSNQADAYHRMIAAEDVDGNLISALCELTAWRGKRVVDIGTGTGRLPLLIAGECARIVGFDLHWDMLRENDVQRELAGGRWSLAQSDVRALPLASACADVVTAGWAIGHLRGWHASDWQAHIGRAVAEMQRIATPGAILIIMETMTTGGLRPSPPTVELAEYYTWLEERWGFSGQVISTDYQFESVDEAVALTEFFFGPELAENIRQKGWSRLPEWTGIWWKNIP